MVDKRVDDLAAKASSPTTPPVSLKKKVADLETKVAALDSSLAACTKFTLDANGAVVLTRSDLLVSNGNLNVWSDDCVPRTVIIFVGSGNGNFTYKGFASGELNEAIGGYANVLGGPLNTAHGWATVTGGRESTAPGTVL